MPHISVLTGAGGYQDPWHPFSVTSARLVELLTQLPGATVSTRTDIDNALVTLNADTSLLVLNFGNAGPGTPSAAARRQLARWVDSGGALLAMHVAATAFPDWDEWEQILGGRWVRGTTFHPPKALGIVSVNRDHTIGAEMADFPVLDEFYTEMRVSSEVDVVAEHTWEQRRHPLAWTVRRGNGRVAYIGLGHDSDAYQSSAFANLVLGAASWLLTPGRDATDNHDEVAIDRG